MIICNFKIDGNKFIKYSICILFILIILLCGIVIYKIFGNTINNNSESYINNGDLYNITANNYTTFLDDVHKNIDSYVGKKIKFSGFVYRVYDFSDEQFVLGRNMVISSDFQTVVVGFLCESPESKNFSDGSWVEIEGEIIKGDYHGEIPIIKISSIKEIIAPSDELVYPPD